MAIPELLVISGEELLLDLIKIELQSLINREIID